MKKINLLPLLLISPLLFMANSPAPYAYEGEYEDFEVTDLVLNKEGTNDYSYSLSLSNLGEGYLSLNRFDLDYYVDYSKECSGILSSDLYLLPHETCSLKGHIYEEVNEDDILFHAYAFKTYSFVEYKNITYKEKEVRYGDDITYYCYSFEIDGYPSSDDFYYTYLVEFSFGEIDFAINARSSYFEIAFKEEIDPSNITFNRMVAIQGREKRNNYITSIWITVWVIVGIIFFLGFLASLIVVPLVVLSKKPWRKKF